MKNVFKKSTALLLSMLLFVGVFALPSSAASMTEEAWGSYFGEYWADGSAPLLEPGKDETERNISWYTSAEENEGYVLLSENSDMSDSLAFITTYDKAIKGDIRHKVTLSGLEAATTYYYQYCTQNSDSAVYSFKTLDGKEFSAFLASDIHIGYHEDDISETAKRPLNLHNALSAAMETKDIELILSSGDQAESGLREEYVGLLASPLLRSVPIATILGNHDRKDYASLEFFNHPNEYKEATTYSKMGYNYWFVKGDVLFLMYDSNNSSAKDHQQFTAKAVAANPDVKWRVAVMHHDLYGGRIPSREQENTLLRILFTPIFDEFNVDIVFMGHSHFYTVSNVMYGNKTAQKLGGLNEITDAKGTIYMVSASLNKSRFDPESGEIPPLGENIGQFHYLSNDTLYSIIDFTNDAIVVNSYALQSGENFNTLTINKTSQEGGHPEYTAKWYTPFIYVLSLIAAFFNNIGNLFEVVYGF